MSISKMSFREWLHSIGSVGLVFSIMWLIIGILPSVITQHLWVVKVGVIAIIISVLAMITAYLIDVEEKKEEFRNKGR